jgi:hypothetical protein
MAITTTTSLLLVATLPIPPMPLQVTISCNVRSIESSAIQVERAIWTAIMSADRLINLSSFLQLARDRVCVIDGTVRDDHKEKVSSMHLQMFASTRTGEGAGKARFGYGRAVCYVGSCKNIIIFSF